MIEELTDLPDGVFGLRVGRVLDRREYVERITPLVEQATGDGARLRCLIEIDDDFTGLTPAAVVDDVRLGLGSVGAYDGVAVATDLSGIRTATEWAAFLTPFAMRVFPRAQRAEAARWLASLPAGAAVRIGLDTATGVVTVDVDEALRIEDFEALAATVDPWMKAHGELSGLVLHVRRVPGWTSLGSLIRHVRFVLGHQGKLGRLALATDVHAAAALASVVEKAVHPEVRAFSYNDLEAARGWAAGHVHG